MNRSKLRLALFIADLLLILLLTAPSAQVTAGMDKLAPPSRPPVQTQTDPEWKRVSPEGEEFSFNAPVKPSLFIWPGTVIIGPSRETVLEHKAYSAYADGFIFALESYRASNPKNLLKDLGSMFSKLQPLDEVKINGFSGQRYRLGTDNNYFGYLYSFVTKKHVYILKVAARTESHPFIERFLSSFSLGKQSGAGELSPVSEDNSPPKVDAQTIEGFGPFTTSREAQKRAAIVWRPEPGYTDAARRSRTKGTVVLRAIFTSSGQVVVTEVVRGLQDGLTERAIEAARNTRFLPSEKDGRAFSQRTVIEYNFNVY